MSKDNLCRLCGKDTNDYIDIFDENGVKKELSTKALSCLNIYVYPNDVLPRVMCVPCCRRLDDSYEFFEKSTKIQSQLRSLYQNGKDIAIVRAEHSYAMNTPQEKLLGQTERREETTELAELNCVLDEHGRALYDLLSNIGAEYTQELDLKTAQTDSVLLENQNYAESNQKEEHNYFRMEPVILPKKRRTIHEMEHNYGRPYPSLIRNDNRIESSQDLENNNRCVGRTISDIWEGYPWSCTICDVNELSSVSVRRMADARRSYFSC